jgi:hypothetical protein
MSSSLVGWIKYEGDVNQGRALTRRARPLEFGYSSSRRCARLRDEDADSLADSLSQTGTAR